MPRSSSGIRWPGRPSTARPRPIGGARCIALWPARCPTPMSTAGPGIWRWPRSAPTPLLPPRLSRPACEHVSAVPMRSRREPTSVAAAAAWLGGLADRAAALLEEASQCAAAPDLVLAIEHLRGHIALRRGPIMQAQEILVAAAAQAESADTDRAVVMLAEAVWAAFCAADAAAMLLA